MKWSWRGVLRLCRLSEAKNPHEGLIPGGRNEVELEGIEPSSKQGRTVLSTRLFRTSFSCTGKTRTTNQYLIL